jgi:fimbrial chaperone protein
LAVSPVSLEFVSGGSARSIEISNPGDAPTDVQVRLFSWSADEVGDHYAPSADIGFSPPIFHLAPGARQVVRLALLSRAEGGERAYRLFVDQLPSAPEPGELQMPIRMILPLFVEPARTDGRKAAAYAAAGSLKWKAIFDPDRKRVRLIAANDGARRVKLMNLAYVQGAASHPISPGLAGYVLAGARRAWDLDYTAKSENLTIRADTDGGSLTVQVPLLPG